MSDSVYRGDPAVRRDADAREGAIADARAEARVMTIRVTPVLRAAIDDVTRALATYEPGGMSASHIEIPKLELADAFLAAYHAQGADRRARLPQRAVPTPVIEVQMRPKRRQAR